ncbi:unnamed protein product [Cylindrotheca closterium]|uniref:Uncharacterized protein n=1 Tax=Cylindrotheca closterium TaxID=2856 RepID=A0AAD2GBY6_9STRA|nr:unnamed protein product [Cylindrotheca closterium]
MGNMKGFSVCGLVLLFSLAITNGFREAQLTHRKFSLHQLRSHRKQREELVKQRGELVNILETIDELKNDLNGIDSEIDLSKSRIAINHFGDEVVTALAALVPPIGLSTEEYVEAMRFYLHLPPSVRNGLVERLNLEGETAGDYQMIPDIIASLYEEHTSPSLSLPGSLSNKTAIQKIATGGNLDEILQDSTPVVESTFRALFGYLSRHTKKSPTSEEIASLMKILKDEKKISNGNPIKVPGAYVISGIERKVNAESLLNCIDASVPEDWDCSFLDLFGIDALPSLSVGVLKLSTFGGSFVDYVNGGRGFITAQENDATVPLHPLFIAGYCGMIISAVSLLPVGATDGGRLSLAIFGRQGHALVSGVTWLALLGASLTLNDDQGRVLTAALVVNSLVQNDMEIPCRIETDEVDTKRLALCFTLWFLAALILVPM